MDKKSPGSGLTGPAMTKKREKLALFARDGLGHGTRTQTTGADGQSANTAVRKLVTHALKIGVKAALGLDIGMAHEIANLGLFAAEIAFLAHTILRICKKQFTSNAAKPWPGAVATAFLSGHDRAKRLDSPWDEKRQDFS